MGFVEYSRRITEILSESGYPADSFTYAMIMTLMIKYNQSTFI